jgi:hypothetical protein
VNLVRNWKRLAERHLTLYTLVWVAAAFAAGSQYTNISIQKPDIILAESAKLREMLAASKQDCDARTATLQNKIDDKDNDFSRCRADLISCGDIVKSVKEERDTLVRERGESESSKTRQYIVRIKKLEKEIEEQGKNAIDTDGWFQSEKKRYFNDIANLTKQNDQKDKEIARQVAEIESFENQIESYKNQMKEKDKKAADRENRFKLEKNGYLIAIANLTKQNNQKDEVIARQGIEIKQLNKQLEDKIAENPQPSTKSSAKAEFNKCLFRVAPCKRLRSEEAVQCEVSVMNTGKKEISLCIGGSGNFIAGPSYIYDMEGNQNPAYQVTFGTESRERAAEAVVLPGLPMIAILKFKDVRLIGEKVKIQVGCAARHPKLNSLGIKSYGSYSPAHNAVINDVSLSKELE